MAAEDRATGSSFNSNETKKHLSYSKKMEKELDTLLGII